MNVDKIKGTAVVSLEEGLKLGTIDHALYDPTTLELRALQVTGDGRTFVIPWDLITTIGADAVMVANSQATQTATQGGTMGNLVDRRTLQRLKVVDAAGTLVGTLSDLESDQTTGAVLRITVSKGGFLGRFAETTTIDAASVRGIGANIVTVADTGTVAAGTELHAATP
jgi:sporulation protein YlmC with PRC-barrel domain